MALAQVLSTADAATGEAANDVFVETAPDSDARGDEDSDKPEQTPQRPSDPPKPKRKARRRRLDQLPEHMPVREIEIHPPEVEAEGQENFELIGEEVTEKIAHQAAQYIRMRITRYKWIRKAVLCNVAAEPSSIDSDAVLVAVSDASADCSWADPGTLVPCSSPRSTARISVVEKVDPEAPRILIAPLPDWVWPRTMADPSAIANVIVSKYDDILPLHRQERISLRHGFHLPRSTQCGWLEAAFAVCYRIVDAMFHESKRTARCIATDATGAPVQGPGKCHHWHVFVFIADNDHVVFRYTPDHTSAAIQEMLAGFKGYLLADAATIFDVLYDEHGMTEVSCWQHARRYFWKALDTEPALAIEALALIAQLFAIERLAREVPMPERTEFRAKRARVV
jgi:transposase